VRGRPGLSPLRYRTRYRVAAAELAAVRKIKEELKLNTADVLTRPEPDTPERVNFLNHTFELAETPEVITEPDPRDLKGVTEAIRNARRMADYVVVSIHAHEGAPGSREIPAQFLVNFAHAAIEAARTFSWGTGPTCCAAFGLLKVR
jgi:Bacterial capsule synthesis protein PGA_cap